MRRISSLAALVAAAMIAGTFSPPADAQPLDETTGMSWGANAGWLDWAAGGQEGALFTEACASGYLYGANIGWIHLGDGSPANGTAYSNADGVDYGVNVDAGSDPDRFLLSGYAYAANAGWISFEAVEAGADRARIDKATGELRGRAWGANIGWIALDTLQGSVQTGLVSLPVGSVVIEVVPENAAWTLTAVGGVERSGVGSSTESDVPAGEVTIEWEPVAGHVAPEPNPAAETLEGGGTLQFLGIYVPDEGENPAGHDSARLIRYLLGLDGDATGLDFNQDSRVDIGDHVFRVEQE